MQTSTKKLRPEKLRADFWFLDGPIRANRFADSRESPDSRFVKVARLQSEFCTKDFFRATNFLTKNAPKFSPKFLSLCSVGQKKSRKIPSKFPTKFSKFPCEKSKKNSPTSCRSAGRKIRANQAIRANRLTPDGSRTEPPFLRIAVRSTKRLRIAGFRRIARIDRHVMKIGRFCESIRVNHPDSRCESPSKFSFPSILPNLPGFMLQASLRPSEPVSPWLLGQSSLFCSTHSLWEYPCHHNDYIHLLLSW